jgi:hypothetical protein
LIEESLVISKAPYRHSPYQKDVIEKLVRELLDNGLIRPSNRAFAAPVLLVKKSDGSWCMCIDYRALNGKTFKDGYPIPLIDDLLDELAIVAHFSKLDLRFGYHLICMHCNDLAKTAFKTHEGHYKFLVMPFRLINAPTFQNLTNDIFKPFLLEFVLVFLDDIPIYNSSWNSHLQHLDQVLAVL